MSTHSSASGPHSTSMRVETVCQQLEKATASCQTVLAYTNKGLKDLGLGIQTAVYGLYSDAEVGFYKTTVKAFHYRQTLGQSDDSNDPAFDAENLVQDLTESISNYTRLAHARNERVVQTRNSSGPRSKADLDADVDADAALLVAYLKLFNISAATVSPASSRGQQAQSEGGYQSGTFTVQSEDSAENDSLKRGATNASAVQDETNRRDALMAFRTRLTVINLLYQWVEISPARLRDLVTDAQRVLNSDGAVPPPAEDQGTNPMETLKRANDKRAEAFRNTGDLMEITYTLMSIENTLKGLPVY